MYEQDTRRNQVLVMYQLYVEVRNAWAADILMKQCQSKEPEIAAMTPNTVYKPTEGLSKD